MSKHIGAAEFRNSCLQILDQMTQDRESVTITKRGRPVAVLSPVVDATPTKTLFGAMAGTVLRYGEPLAPAIDPESWDSNRR
jgi:prevent-host-death family protein